MITAQNGGRGNPFVPRLALLVICVALPPTVCGHQLDEYLQGTLVDIEPDEISVQINLTPGVAVAEQVLAIMDSNHDGVISTNEAAAYAETLKHDLTVRLDDRELPLRRDAFTFPTPAELRTGWGIILMDFSTRPEVLAPGTHRLAFENRHLPGMSVYLLNATHPRSAFVRITGQKRNQNQSSGEIVFDFHPPPRPASPKGAIALLVAGVVIFAVAIAKRKNRRKSP